MTRATVLIPTHDAPDTLQDAVSSALRQTVEDLEVLVVGDGVTPRHREVVEACAALDPRVRFLDLPKGANRGERNRHHGVRAAASDAIVYLGDDDLLLPQHVGNMLGLLRDHELCQSFNGYLDGDDRLRLLPTDLDDPRWRAWHLQDPPRNRVSITGSAHTRAAYDRLPRGWDLAAPGMPTDLTLWRQFFTLPGLRAATHPEMTTVQFPGVERARMDEEGRTAQRARWTRFIAEPDAHARLQALVREAVRTELIEGSALVTDLILTCDARDRALSALVAELEATRRTMSWRLTRPLRAIRRGFRHR